MTSSGLTDKTGLIKVKCLHRKNAAMVHIRSDKRVVTFKHIVHSEQFAFPSMIGGVVKQIVP
jgi:hypothetical protein